MLPLDKDLQQKKKTFGEFVNIAVRVLNYLPNVLGDYQIKGKYKIHASNIASSKKFIRPINQDLFIYSVEEFKNESTKFQNLLLKITETTFLKDQDNVLIHRVIYTIQQSIGAGLDLLVNPNSARKHVGNRFEELIKCIISLLGIANKKIVLKIPYESEKGTKTYKCENDLILSPFPKVKSTNNHLESRELVVSIKTTSKDRMGKMFIDKILLERFVNHKQKVIGIFLNDVQRKNSNNISYTLVSGLFMVYTKFLTKLDGVYYIDPPPNALKEPYSSHMKPFYKLITEDIWELLSS